MTIINIVPGPGTLTIILERKYRENGTWQHEFENVATFPADRKACVMAVADALCHRLSVPWVWL